MRKLPITKARVHVEMDYYLSGSVLAGTVTSGVTEVHSEFEVVSDAPEEEVAYVIRLAKQGCFAERLVETAVPIKSTLKLNGKEATSYLE
ncbi:MAG: OsmC family protein [Dehalococcoidia bacterium]|nr:OsmC family protein [Dehalococcoidia bacterium]